MLIDTMLDEVKSIFIEKYEIVHQSMSHLIALFAIFAFAPSRFRCEKQNQKFSIEYSSSSREVSIKIALIKITAGFG